MFKGPISHNKENINIAPSPLGRKKIFLWISLINMKILIYKFECPISNNKENINFAPPPCAPLDAHGKQIFLNFFD